jgi:hypothetical protein
MSCNVDKIVKSECQENPVKELNCSIEENLLLPVKTGTNDKLDFLSKLC